ncbi:MAG: TRAP transporter large permease [Jhaorihella sp.]
MTPTLALGTGGASILLLLAIRVPIAVTLGLVGVAGIYSFVGWSGAESVLKAVPYNFVAHWTLSAIPMFILMGNIASRAGLTGDLFHAARVWLNWLPGGLAVASIVGAAGFATVTGSSVACAAAMGRIAIPEMLDRKYDPGMAAGTLAAAGLLGSLIPPSVALLLFALFAEVSVAKLFLAATIPGLLTAAAFCLLVILRAWFKPKLAPRDTRIYSWAERFAVLLRLGPVVLVVVGVVGGMVLGAFSPTEAGAVGAFLTLLISVAQRRIDFRSLIEAGRDCLQICAAVFIIAACAAILQRFLALSGVTAMVGDAILASGLGPVGVILIVAGVYVVLGMFLDPIGIMLLTLPVLIPIFETMGINLIWVGILIAKLLEMALITPPVGLNVFVIKSVVGDRIQLTTIFRGVMWFFALEVVILAVLIFVPGLSLWLPGLID